MCVMCQILDAAKGAGVTPGLTWKSSGWPGAARRG